MRILITGASGSMGYYLAEYLANLGGHQLYGIARSDAANVYLHAYDRLDLCYTPENFLVQYLAGIAPQLVFHLASNAHVSWSFLEPREVLKNNILGTQNLLAACSRLERKPKIVMCSTSEVYGNVPPALNPIVETQPIAPVNPYAVSKYAQEGLANYYSLAYDMPIVITRAFGYINPRRRDLVATALARQIVECERGVKSEIIHGDLKPVRSFCDARDIAKAYWLAAKCEPGVFNIGSTWPCSIALLRNLLASLANPEVELHWREEESLKRPTDIFYCYPETRKFKQATGWTPSYSIAESCEWLLGEIRKEFSVKNPAL